MYGERSRPRNQINALACYPGCLSSILHVCGFRLLVLFLLVHNETLHSRGLKASRRVFGSWIVRFSAARGEFSLKLLGSLLNLLLTHVNQFFPMLLKSCFHLAMVGGW